MTAHALERFFNPQSIAVVGASNKPGKMGNVFMRRLANGFAGRIFAINPNEREVADVPALPSIDALPEAVDLLIALVPALRMVEMMEGCRAGLVRHLLAIPSGFGEVSQEGRRLEARLVAAAQRKGTRVIGPNCVGMLNCGAKLNASMMPALPRGGHGISCVTESGGFGMALAMYALDYDLPVAKFCDLGNMIDVQVHEVLRYLAEDPHTRLVALFLEAVRDRDAFLSALNDLSLRKPVILCLVGTSSAGRRASLAHIGIGAATADLFEALPPRIMRASNGIDLLNSSRALLRQPLAGGRRVAIVTGTGGIGAELADLATAEGLEVVELSPKLQDKLRQHLPYYAGVLNPVDLTPIWWDYARIYPSVLKELGQSGEVDIILVSITDVATTLADLREAMVSLAQNRMPPTVIYWAGREHDRAAMHTVEAVSIPCYSTTHEAARAAAALAIGSPRSQAI